MTLAFIPLLLTMQTPLTFGEALRLPPAEAGERALSGLRHGPIVHVQRPQDLMGPPGFVRLILQEQPSRKPEGCIRHWWSVQFNHDPATPVEQARLVESSRGSEVALAIEQNCPEAGYSGFAGNLDAATTLSALRKLEQVIVGATNPPIVCRNSTPSYLCEDRQTTLRELGTLRPGFVMIDQRGRLEFWFGAQGQAQTTAIFESDEDSTLLVSRSAPLPF